MKIVSTLFLLMTFQNTLLAQSDSIVVMGRVTACAGTLDSAVIVKLVLNDSMEVGMPVDSNGRYSFRVPETYFHSKNLLIYAEQDHKPGTKSGRFEDDPCNWLQNTCYAKEYPRSALQQVPYPDTSDTVTVDICMLTLIKCNTRYLTLEFKKDETSFVLYHDRRNADTVLQILSCLLMKNWQVTGINIFGHADSRERHAQKLAEERTELIRQALVKRGVSPEKIYAYPEVRSLTVNRGMSKEDKARQKAMNRVMHLSPVF